MNLLCRINFSKISYFKRLTPCVYSTGIMDSDSEDDLLYYSHQKLSKYIQNADNKKSAVTDYLKTLNYQPIKDFRKGLEWFNVSEPLSFEQHLKGKIVVLDFFTYCCINCMHIIPDLREIEEEFSVEDGLVVIGVHSAKFENEKVSSNILSAVQRYNITHPVVNDLDSDMWKKCDVHCWPTLLILGPKANPIVMLMGEGHKDNLRLYIGTALEFYGKEISNHSLPFKSAYHLLPDAKGPLLFPGKITNILNPESNTEILAVSDSGNNRILVLTADGNILHQIGSGKIGLRDGSFDQAEFNSPQGVAFLDCNTIFVADTENHAIRQIDLIKKEVKTVAGTGKQGSDRNGGHLWTKQAISSPWDVCVYKTADMDMTFYPDGNPPMRNVLLIAMAGTHQIWALFLEDTVWWKCKKYAAGTCLNIAGSGREENRNNSYPQSAAFAQPSGLALCAKNKEVYIADSESSCVRRLSLVDGKVTPVVGGNRNPNNLFAFGDTDGTLFDAKLQHLLGLTMAKDESTLFVADTYNHKLKKVNISENSIETLALPKLVDTTDNNGKQGAIFKEPAGLCVSEDGKKLYLADTNNHAIKVVYLKSNLSIDKIENLELKLLDNAAKNEDVSKYEVVNSKPLKLNLAKGSKLILNANIAFGEGLKLTADAPQKWQIRLPSMTWSSVPLNGTKLVKNENVNVVINIPSKQSDASIDLIFDLVTCTDETCLPKSFMVKVPILGQSDATNLAANINIVLTPNNIQIN